MRRGLAIVGVLSVVAASFFALVASRAGHETASFYDALRGARAKESQATYSIVYDIDDAFGSTHEFGRETAVRLGADRYRSETTDRSGYTIIVIEQPEARFQCEASETITPQCYRTDVRGPLALDDSFVELEDDAFSGVISSTELETTDHRKSERANNQILSRDFAGELATCFIEDHEDLRTETCFSEDGLVLYARSGFELAGQTFVMTKEAVSIDRNPSVIDLEPPYPLVERPTVAPDGIEPVIEIP